MLKIPFAGQTASELGHCPIPACSNFLKKNRTLFTTYRAVARMLFEQRHTACAVGVITWLVVYIAVGYKLLDTFMIGSN